MFLVDFLVRIPFAREEWILLADDLAVKKRCERRVLLRQALDLQVAAEVGVRFVNVLKSCLQ